MADALRKTMIYLGLADGDDHFDSQNETAPVVESKDKVSTKNDDYRAPVTPIKRVAAKEKVGEDLSRITTVNPRSYNDAKTIGESFRDGIPVIMNVSDMSESDAKRLVDFSAGLVFALRGSIERVTNKVFLLSPEFVEVFSDEKSLPPESNFFNQS